MCVIDTPQQQLCMTTGFIGSIPKHPISKKMIDIILWNIDQMHYGMDCLAPNWTRCIHKRLHRSFTNVSIKMYDRKTCDR